jgi:hypothetical protein
MAFSITQNKKNYTCIIHASVNSSIVLVGNSSVNSDIAIEDEVIESATIRQTWFSSSSGHSGGGAIWTVDRDGTTVAVYDSTGWVDYAGNGHELDVAKANSNTELTSNLDVTITGGTELDGFIMMEIRKNVALPANTGGY